jgi:hypothetical protein
VADTLKACDCCSESNDEYQRDEAQKKANRQASGNEIGWSVDQRTVGSRATYRAQLLDLAAVTRRGLYHTGDIFVLCMQQFPTDDDPVPFTIHDQPVLSGKESPAQHTRLFGAHFPSACMFACTGHIGR